MFTKQTLARLGGWGYAVIDYINQVIQANGGLLPTTKSGWIRLAGTLLLAGGIHHAAATSAENPTGHK